MKNKIIAVVLAAMFLFTCGCGSNNDTGDNVGTVGEEDKERTIFTVNGSEITEEYFEYFVYYYKTELESVYGEITDWNAELQDGMTNWEYIKHMACEWYKFAGAVRFQAARLGLELTEEDETRIREDWDSMCSSYGGEETVIKELESYHCTKDVYKYIVETNIFVEKCFTEMYGENGSSLTDEDCADKTAEDDYIMAKHILIMTSGEDEEGNTVEFTDDEKAEALKKAESIITQLDQCEPEEIEGRFDELMISYTEDPGIASFPNGYLFQSGDMMEEFYNAAAELEIGSYSGIVETSAGYHIILRIPVNFDVVPMAYSSYLSYGYDYYTLRYITADSMFQSNLETWMERVEIEYENIYEDITIEELLAVG